MHSVGHPQLCLGPPTFDLLMKPRPCHAHIEADEKGHDHKEPEKEYIVWKSGKSVVPIFCPYQPFSPCTRLLRNKTIQISLQTSIDHLYLPIKLRMSHCVVLKGCAS